MMKTTQANPDVINFLAANLGGVLTVITVGLFGSLGWLSVKLGITFWESKITNPQNELKEQQRLMAVELNEQKKEINDLKHSNALALAMLTESLKKQDDLKLQMTHMIDIFIKNNKD